MLDFGAKSSEQVNTDMLENHIVRIRTTSDK